MKSSRLLAALKRLGGWPLIELNWTTTGFDLSKLLGELKRDYTVDALFTTYVYADAKNTSRNVLHVNECYFNLLTYFSVTEMFKLPKELYDECSLSTLLCPYIL